MSSRGEGPPAPTAARRSRLDSRKLLQSKWTAVAPVDRELHFVLTRIVPARARSGAVRHVELRAVLTGRTRIVERDELTDSDRWQPGWR